MRKSLSDGPTAAVILRLQVFVPAASAFVLKLLLEYLVLITAVLCLYPLLCLCQCYITCRYCRFPCKWSIWIPKQLSCCWTSKAVLRLL